METKGYVTLPRGEDDRLPIDVSSSGHVYEDFTRLLFLNVYREASILTGELEESDHFGFLRSSLLDNLNGSVVLILTKTSVIRVTIPIDLSTRSFIPLPRFFNSRRVIKKRGTPSFSSPLPLRRSNRHITESIRFSFSRPGEMQDWFIPKTGSESVMTIQELQIVVGEKVRRTSSNIRETRLSTPGPMWY